jgi:sodium/bile acid cotransporter 7
MTEAAAGNEAVSLINATMGNILGIVVSPTLLLIYLGARTQVDFAEILITMPVTVIGPLLLGQIVRKFAPTFGMSLLRLLHYNSLFFKSNHHWTTSTM